MPINFVAGSAYQNLSLVEKQVLAANESEVVFSGLDLVTDGNYLLKAAYQTINNCVNISLIVNADSTVTNYYHVECIFDGAGTSTTVYSENNNILNSIDESLIDVYCEASFKLDLSTKLRAFSQVTYINPDGTSQNMNINSLLHNVAENVTSLTIQGDGSTGDGKSFAAGSVFELYRLKPI